jgi:hypothetical protein
MPAYKHEESNGRCILCGSVWPCPLENYSSYYTERAYPEITTKDTDDR